MDKGTYAAASAGLLQMRKLEVVNNNLANVNTPGFKRQLLVGKLQSFDETLAKQVEAQDPFARADHERMPGTVHIRSVTDFTPGSVKDTSNPLDVALRHPKDFFVVTTPDGERYTRAGNFTLNAEAELVTQDGFPIVGDGGAIVANGTGVNIESDGTVRASGTIVGKVKVVRIEKTEALEHVEGTRFKLARGGAAPTDVEAELVPQSLEMANVNAVGSMVDLITTNRAFDLYTRSAMSIDQLNQTAISQIGRRST
jgi:flagellar basal-body rod protein FlgF